MKIDNLNPTLRVFMPASVVAAVRAVLLRHEPVLQPPKIRLAERVMEIVSAEMLGRELPDESPTLRLAQWGEVTHALACRWSRASGDEKVRVMTIFRWVKMRLRADREAAIVLDYWKEIERAEAKIAAARTAEEDVARARREAEAQLVHLRSRGR